MKMRKIKLNHNDADYLLDRLEEILHDNGCNESKKEVLDRFYDYFDKNNCEEEKLSNFESIGKNLKPFDLEAAKEGKPVCTRDGRKARIICFDKKGSIIPIIALIEDENGDEFTYSFYQDGRFFDDRDDDYDLMMLIEKREGWVNVYNDYGTYHSTYIYKTEKEAISQAGTVAKNYVATVKIEWYE